MIRAEEAPQRAWDQLLSVRHQLPHSAWAPALTYQSIDLLEGLLNPLYQALLAAERGHQPTPPGAPPHRRIAAALHRLLLQRRSPDRVARWLARRHSARPTEAAVCFWPREITHLEVQIPVADALQRRGVEVAWVAGAPHLAQELHRRKIPSLFPAAAWPEALAVARRWGEGIGGTLTREPGVPLPHAGVVRRTLRSQLPVAARATATALGIAATVHPGVLVVGNDLTLEGRLGALVAQTRSIATAALMHGLVSAEPMHGQHRVDRFLVYGEASRKLLLACGAAADRIAVTGCPKLDPPPRQLGHIHPQLARRLNLQTGEPWILVAFSGPGHSVSHDHHRRLIEAVGRASTALPEVRFVARLHRKDAPEPYRAMIDRVPGARLTVVRHGQRGYPTAIFDWLQGCRGVITGASTVAVEAMLMEVPVITLDLMQELATVDFVLAGATLHAISEATLTSAVENVLRDERGAVADRARRFARETFHPPEGGAAARTAQSIAELIPGGGRNDG